MSEMSPDGTFRGSKPHRTFAREIGAGRKGISIDDASAFAPARTKVRFAAQNRRRPADYTQKQPAGCDMKQKALLRPDQSRAAKVREIVILGENAAKSANARIYLSQNSK